jgi:hypothetical protein
MEPWHGRGGFVEDDYEGMRIFDVAVNGDTVINDLDPWAEAGYLGAMKRVVYAKAKNGRLRISFPEVKAGQAVICGIAIARKGGHHPSSASSLPTNYWHSLNTDTIAKLPKELLPLDSESRPATAYEPQKQRKGQGTAFVIKTGLGQEYALRFRYKNTTGEAVKARLTLVDTKKSVLVDRDITFPPTPNKFKILSTTTGTQINAGTYTVLINSPAVEFSNLEVQ